MKKSKTQIIGTLLLLVCSIYFGHAQYRQTINNYTCLVNNPKGTLPLADLSEHNIALLLPHKDKYKDLQGIMARYSDIKVSDYSHYEENTKLYNTIIAVVDNRDDLKDKLKMLEHSSRLNKKVILLYFGKKENLPKGLDICIMATDTVSKQSEENLAMSVFGGMAITEGIPMEQIRLQYTFGKGSDLDLSGMKKKINRIAEEAIREKATPGLVVMVVKNGQVIFEESYGHHTYSMEKPTNTEDIFDLASVSKIAGTTPVVMHLQERRILDLDGTMGSYLWQSIGTDKENISLRSVMLHEAGFTPYIPFYRYLKEGDLLREKALTHQTKVADSAFLINNYYRDVMWPEMLASKVKPTGKYVYSDISMYVMQEVSENLTSESMDKFVDKILYRKIGMKTAGYNPRKRFDKDQIVPTEWDTTFRKVLLEGYVHDQGAAMAGGVAGHAGLFASANDLAIYAQMLLNRGEYGGVRYFRPETVDLFTSNQSQTSRRGLGFDRWDPNPENEYPCRLANRSVYGHTGYTGTCIWIDPENQLTYIFLSNRVHPQVSTKLLNLNIRSRIQDVIYETIGK